MEGFHNFYLKKIFFLAVLVASESAACVSNSEQQAWRIFVEKIVSLKDKSMNYKQWKAARPHSFPISFVSGGPTGLQSVTCWQWEELVFKQWVECLLKLCYEDADLILRQFMWLCAFWASDSGTEMFASAFTEVFNLIFNMFITRCLSLL